MQIRLSWDQAALLKQLDIIGKSGRNWPIKDSREQIKLIESCLKASGVTSASTKGHKEILTTARGSSTNVLRDPHATLHIQASREEVESAKNEQVVSPYGGNRPHQRSFMDVLGDEAEGSDSANLSRQRNMSPAKAGSNKHFQPMRIFDGQDEHVEDEDTPKERNASQFLRPNPKKYNHFDLADGTDPQDAPIAGVSFKDKPKSRHDSQWSFEDVVTPSKPRPSKSTRSQDVRHWDTDNATYAGETPIQGGKGRRDANTQFELQDDGERVAHADKPGARGRGTVQNEQLGLYKNKLFDENEDGAEPERALGNITNLGHRGKDFDPHFRMADESPSNQAHTQKQKENTRLGKPQDDAGIHIAGDGMGGKKGTNRDWLYGGEGEQELPKPTTARRAAHPNSQSSKQSSLWDF